MLIVPGDDDARSVGSFFKNPVVPQSCFEELASRVRPRRLQLPSYSAANGFRKLPAAWLVEHAGFAKGYTKGAAGITRQHLSRHHQPRGRDRSRDHGLEK